MHIPRQSRQGDAVPEIAADTAVKELGTPCRLVLRIHFGCIKLQDICQDGAICEIIEVLDVRIRTAGVDPIDQSSFQLICHDLSASGMLAMAPATSERQRHSRSVA